MLNGKLFCSPSPGLQNGHMIFITNCLINKESQLSKSLRHVAPSASSCWNMPYHGMFKEHQPPFETSECCTALWCVILKGSQNLLSYCCLFFFFLKDSFIIFMVCHDHFRLKPPKTFITALLCHSSIVQLSPFHKELGLAACDHGPNMTSWAPILTFLGQKSDHLSCTGKL